MLACSYDRTNEFYVSYICTSLKNTVGVLEWQFLESKICMT